MSGARQAALTLHALQAGDRDWMLAQLPETQRAALRGMLDDLTGLGIPADSQLIQDAAKPMTPPAEPTVVRDSQGAAVSSGIESIRRATAESLHVVLADETDELIAMLLSIEDFVWRHELLAMLLPRKRAAIQRRTARPLAPALSAALVACIARRLDDLAPPECVAADEPAEVAPAWPSGFVTTLRARLLAFLPTRRGRLWT